MMQDVRYSMAYLTGNGACPAEAVEIAATAGYDMLSFRMLPASGDDRVAPFMQERGYTGKIAKAVRDAGLAVADIEMLRIGRETGITAHDSFFGACATIGAKHVLTLIDIPGKARAVDLFGGLCMRAAGFGLTLDLEFIPYSAVKTPGDALDIIRASGAANARIIVDCLHVDRSGVPLAELEKIKPGEISLLQICDGKKPFAGDTRSLMHVARHMREIPGEGDIDIAGMLAAIRAPIVAVEVPNRRLSESMTRLGIATAALEASRKITGAAWE